MPYTDDDLARDGVGPEHYWNEPGTDFGYPDADGWDRNGAFDGFQVVSDADPGL